MNHTDTRNSRPSLFAGAILLLLTPTVSSGVIQISDSPVSGGEINPNYRLTTDGSRVVYPGDLTTDNVDELYAASTTSAGTQITLNNTPVAGGEVSVFSLELTADGSRVVYRGDLTTDGVNELYSASTSAAGTQITLNNTPVLGGVAAPS